MDTVSIEQAKRAGRQHYEETVADGGLTERELALAWCLYSIERTGDADQRPVVGFNDDTPAPIYVILARNILRRRSNKAALIEALDA